MKKFLLTLFVVFLALSLTACGSKTEGEENNEEEKEKTSEVENKEEANEEEKEEADEYELYSDDTKMVFKRANAQLVFYYSGDKITAYHEYIDYGNAATANTVLSFLEKDETIEKAYVQGKYLVIEYAKSEYENLTVKEVRDLYAALEAVQGK